MMIWALIGALGVLGLWVMQAVTSGRGIAFTAGQWAVYGLWLAWTLFGVAFVWTSWQEKERRSVLIGIALFGGVSAAGLAGIVLGWVVA